MKKNNSNISKAAALSLIVGSVTGFTSNTNVSDNLGFQILGNGNHLRSKLIRESTEPHGYSANASEKEVGEGKCGEGKCGGSKTQKSTPTPRKDAGEGKCGEGKCG